MPEIIDPFDIPEELGSGIIDPFDKQELPSEVPFTLNPSETMDWSRLSWENVKKDLPVLSQDEEKKVKNSLTLSATYDINPALAYEMHDSFARALNNENSFYDKAMGSAKNAIGSLYTTVGYGMKMMNYFPVDADTYINYGERLKLAYIPPDIETRSFGLENVMPSFKRKELTSWEKYTNPEWMAIHSINTVPFALALIPATVVGAYVGVGGATALGMGAFGRWILGSIGGSVLSSPIEAGMEAANAYETAIKSGKAHEESRGLAGKVFTDNLALLLGSNAAEIALAFTPLNLGAKTSSVMMKRILAAGGKIATIAGSGIFEAGEERWQEKIQMKAEGKDVSLFDFQNPRMNDSAAIGGVFGLGFGGAGSVWTALRNRLLFDMPKDLRNVYEDALNEALRQGRDITQTEVLGLDAVMAVPEGEAHIKAAVDNLKAIAEGKEEGAVRLELKPPVETAIEPEPVNLESIIDDLIQDTEFDTFTDDEIVDLLTEIPNEEQGTSQVGQEPPTGGAVTASAEALAEPKASETGLPDEGLFKNLRDETGAIGNLKDGFYDRIEAALRSNHPDASIPLVWWKRYAKEVLGVSTTPVGFDAIWRKLISAVDNRAGYDLLGGMSIEEVRLNRNQGKYTGWKPGKDVALETFGFQSLYEGLEAFVKSGKINEGISYLTEIGRRIYEQGKTTLINFTDSMKLALGSLWDNYKGYIGKVWNAIKDERGSVGIESGDDAKRRIRKITGQVKPLEQVRETSALKAGMKKAEQAGKAGFKAGVEAGIEKALTPTPETIKQRIARISGMAKDKATIGEDVALREGLIKAARAARLAFRAGDMEGVAREKAKMKEFVTKLKERKKTKENLKYLKRIKEKAKGKISLDYQKKLEVLLEGIDLVKPSEETIERLKGLNDFIQREGVPLGISQKDLSQLDRLNKIAFRDMSPEAQANLMETAQKFYDYGKLKREFQLNHEERQLAKELKVLTDGTINLDPELSGEEKPTQWDTFKTGLTKVQMDLLHTFRQADKADGSKDYQGQNAKMIKKEMHTEISAKNEAQRRIHEGILGKLQSAGIEDITEEMQERINVVLMAEQGARQQVATLLEEYDMVGIPELTPTERTFVDIVRPEVASKEDISAKVKERRENIGFVRVKNYWPIKYVGEGNTATSESVNQNRHRTRETEHGFTETRVPGVKQIPRKDLLSVAEEAIIDQEWYNQMQPVLDEHNALIRTPEYKEAAGVMMWNYWKDQIDIVANKGWTSSTLAQSNPGSRMLKQMRLNITQAILGYKVSTSVLQLFAVFDAVAYATARWGTQAGGDVALAFTQTWLNPKEAMEFAAANPALKLRKAGEIAVEDVLEKTEGMKGIKKKYFEYALKGITIPDVITATGIQKGLFKILQKQGVLDTDIEAESEFLMNLASGTSEVTMRPHILARGEGARMWFTFQSFFLNRWGLITEDIIRTGIIKGDSKRKATAALGLMILIAGGIAADEARDLIYELTTGKNSTFSDESLFKQILLYLPKQIPIAGSLFDFGSAEPPLLRTAGKIGRGAQQITSGNAKGLLGITEGGASLFLGYPGTAQFFDLVESAMEE